jgi:large subunit ribosomal protein L24
MATKFKIKKNDRVMIITGKDKGKIGNVTKVLPKEERVVVAGVNQVSRHKRPDAKSAGGIIKLDAPLHVSNVAHIDPKDDKPTRVGLKLLADGRKVRFAKRSGEQLDK